MSEFTTHKELMLAMGSTSGTYDPTAPEWYMRLMTSRDPVEQVMGWLQYRTIRYPIHTPYASDELGRVLTLKDVAAFFKWTTRHTQRVWARIEAKHYARKTEGKLWLRADFKVKYPILTEDAPTANVVSINPTESYLDSLAPYLREQVAQLPAGRIAELAARWTAWDHARKDVEADAMQAAREKMKPYETALYGEYKVTVKSLPERQERRAKTAHVKVQIDLFDFSPLPQNSAVQDSAALNPLGAEQVYTSSAPAPRRRTVDTPPVAPNPNTQERVTKAPKAPKTSNKRTPEHGATEKSSTMGRSTGGSSPQAGISKVREEAAADFHDVLAIRFHDVGAGIPSRKHTDPLFDALGSATGDFLDWLSPLELQSRKPRHGGVLPSLLEEFQKLATMGPRRPLAMAAQAETQPRARKLGFAEGVMAEAERRLKKYGRI
jgi:hypothetical protein